MWNHRLLLRLDWRFIPIILSLMIVSLLVIASTDPAAFGTPDVFFTPKVQRQLQRFILGWGVFLVFAALDYSKLRDSAFLLYIGMIVALLGLFFVPAIQNVHRWYRIPIIGASIQPAEYAKLVVVIALSWFLEQNRSKAASWSTSLMGCVIVGIPFLLILKEPDLGTALVLCPICCVMFYLGGAHPKMVRLMFWGGGIMLVAILLIFMGIFSHEGMRPVVTRVLKEYQYERLNPDNHHQWAALTAIGVGGLTGSGWRASTFTGRGWLPYGYTDSVFPAFGEEFGLVGLLILLVLFYMLIYFGFQVTAVAKDHFGRMLSAGITVYLAMHVLINIGMMCGMLPITGVPLILVSYGGSSIFVTMAALGILQSVYTRRFMF
ncbi:MAG: FtsW/RodA/SpoVE family cell cycle protein [Chlamydiales bacterium]|nr:FtsW/RodA/SpoVE family cell cycle protein [Chlamydiales bacterium]